MAPWSATRFLIVTLSTAWSQGALAQTITLAEAPAVGDVFHYAAINADSVFPSGPDQSWAIDGNVQYSYTTHPLEPAGQLPGAVHFPEATIGGMSPDSGTVEFHRVSPEGLDVLGYYDVATGNWWHRPDPERYMVFPCTYGTTWADGYMVVEGLTGDTTDIEPTHDWVADGYGTLTVNGAPIENVLKTRKWYTYTVIQGMDTFVVEVEYNRFWKPGIHMPVADHYRTTSLMNGEPHVDYAQVYVATALNTGVAGADTAAAQLALLPNAARGSFQAVFTATGQVDLTVTDAAGRVVRRIPTSSAGPSLQRVQVDLGDAAPGSYIVRLTDAARLLGTARLVIE